MRCSYLSQSTPARPSGARASTSTAPELIRLDKLPSDWKHSVSIGSLLSSVELERLSQALIECGGPLANLVLHKAPDRTWATAQFFCDGDAERFRHNCDGRRFCGQRLEVKRLIVRSGLVLGGSTPGPTPVTGAHALDITASKAFELLTHYLGFDGWSHELVDIQPMPPGDRDGSFTGGSSGASSYRAHVRVHAGGACVLGVGESGHHPGEAASQVPAMHRPGETAAGGVGGERVMHVGHLKKAAVTNALKAAVRKLALVRFPGGKVCARAIDTRDDERHSGGCAGDAGSAPTATSAPSRQPPSKRARVEDASGDHTATSLMPPPPPRPPQALGHAGSGVAMPKLPTRTARRIIPLGGLDVD